MGNKSSKEIFAFYNVENLLLPDPPPVHRLDPTLSGLRNWDARKYRIKLSKIVHVFQLMADSEGVMPAVIGLCEVQGCQPLEELISEPLFKNYQIVHYGSPDRRGIDVALLYDRSKLELISSEPLTFDIPTDSDAPDTYSTRDILHCKFRYCGHVLNILVLHLPSKRERDINKNRRAYILQQLQQTILSRIPKFEALLICGDFNANPDDEHVTKLLYDDDFVKILTNPFRDLLGSDNFSTFHHGNGLLFDQMLMSDEFYRSDFPLRFKAAKIFSHEKLRVRDRKLSGRPAKTFAGTRYLGGYSDHFPVLTEFEKP